MLQTPANCKTQIREAAASAAAKGLDTTVAAVEEALVAAWTLERRGVIAPRDVRDLVEAVQAALKKIAPPPPKKVKFSDPLRKILPLAETGVKPGADVALFLLALTQVGDFTEQPDKKRHEFELFLDDWRRMIWESARIPDWKRFRELVGREERMLEGRLSRESALGILEAIANRRVDNITPIPDVSMLACSRCGGFRGRDRSRCATCHGTFCTRCLGPTADVCITDYATRYAPIEPERRQKVAGDARAILKEFKLDPYSRNDAFVRALKERGVDVTFQDLASLEGQETHGPQGRMKFLLCDRQGPATKRALFGALARTAFRAAEIDPDPLLTDFFVDLCLGLPIEDALKAQAPRPA
ncbi:MAG TPA: hypothetical protein VEN81_02405 [Planctomycetota bacterium]|nr:hypothetical protein [Planctomycetota bacterium]